MDEPIELELSPPQAVIGPLPSHQFVRERYGLDLDELEEFLKLELVADDGEPLESAWHRKCMNLLIENVEYQYRNRQDYFVGGNQFIYYARKEAVSVSEGNKPLFRGPDFYFVPNTNRQPNRDCWAVFDEGGLYPSVIIELASPSTISEDRGPKKVIYQNIFRSANYYVYDPVKQTLEGWELVSGKYVPLQTDQNGRLFCKELNLWLGQWEGTFQGDYDRPWLRFYDSDGKVVPTFGEAERDRADSEKQRADAAEAELNRLRAMLASLPRPTE